MARRHPRTLAAIAALAVAGLGLSACSAASPILTSKSYATSDGVRAQFSEHLRAENLMVLTEGSGAPATLYGALVNNSEEPATFTIQVGELPAQTIKVTPKSVVNLPTKDAKSGSTSVKPGATVAGQVGTMTTGSINVSVPVLDGTIPPYNEYVKGK